MTATPRKTSADSTSRSGRTRSATNAGVVSPIAKALGGQSMPHVDHGAGSG